MRYYIFILWFAYLLNGVVKAQNYTPSQNLNFINYLTKNNNATDVKTFSSTLNNADFNLSQMDSLNYFKAWANYFTKDFDTAVWYFDNVSQGSQLYSSSVFHSVFCNTFKGNFNLAHEKLKLINDSSMLLGFKKLNSGAIFLMQRNYTAFDSVAQEYKGTYYQFSTEEKELMRIASDLKKQKQKSPLKALALSAIVPGLGKYYAGYWGKAVSTFLPVVVFGTLTAESLYKAGPKSPQFIILGSIFSAFYLGNLYGTYYSVKIRQNEIYNKNNSEILLNVHIPLRRIFNQ